MKKIFAVILQTVIIVCPSIAQKQIANKTGQLKIKADSVTFISQPSGFQMAGIIQVADDLPNGVVSIEMEGVKTVVRFSNGQTEVYDLSLRDEVEKITTKFGAKLVSLSSVIQPANNTDSIIQVLPANSNRVQMIDKDGESPSPGVVNIPVNRKNINVIQAGNGKLIIDTMQVGKRQSGSTKNAALSYGITMDGDEDMFISITKNADMQELENLKKQVNQKGGELLFDEINYNKEDVITSIAGSLIFNNQNNRFEGSDFHMLLLKMATKSNKTFFKKYIINW